MLRMLLYCCTLRFSRPRPGLCKLLGHAMSDKSDHQNTTRPGIHQICTVSTIVHLYQFEIHFCWLGEKGPQQRRAAAEELTKVHVLSNPE